MKVLSLRRGPKGGCEKTKQNCDFPHLEKKKQGNILIRGGNSIKVKKERKKGD